MDAQQLTQAADLIRQRLGARFEATQEQGMVHMRQAVQDGIGVDEGEADRLVKQLANSRLVVYHSSGEIQDESSSDVRDAQEPDELQVDDRGLNRIPPQGFSTSMGIAGTGQNIIPPVPDSSQTNSKRDDYIDRGAMAIRGLGEADAYGEGGYWEVPDIAGGAVTQAGGPTGPDYDIGGGNTGGGTP